MGVDHNYNLVKEAENDLDEPQQYQPQLRGHAVVAWWKLVAGNLLAAAVGATIMFLFARTPIVIQSSSTTPTSAAKLAEVSAAPISLATATLTVTATTTTTAKVSATTAALILATPGADDALVNNPAYKILDCGGSPEEARAKDCVYDVMMQDWVPKPCYDEVLTERYLAKGNWTWYADGDGNEIIPDDVMRKGEHGSAFMSNSYHKAHCVFSWLKLVRALRTSTGISQELLSYDHVLHCAHGALKAADSDNAGIGVSAPTNYARCAIYETWKLDFIPDKHNSTD